MTLTFLLITDLFVFLGGVLLGAWGMYVYMMYGDDDDG